MGLNVDSLSVVLDTERKTKKERNSTLPWVIKMGHLMKKGGGGLKKLDGAKSEMASSTVTQVHSIPRDPADQLTRP